MNPAFQRYVEAASGFTNLTVAKAEQIAKALIRSGAAAGEQASDLVDDLMARQRKNRETASRFVKQESERAVRAMGLATSKDVAALERKIASLERQLATAKKSAAKKSTAKKATKKSAAKKSTAKKATKKSAAKRSTAKKATPGGAR